MEDEETARMAVVIIKEDGIGGCVDEDTSRFSAHICKLASFLFLTRQGPPWAQSHRVLVDDTRPHIPDDEVSSHNMIRMPSLHGLTAAVVLDGDYHHHRGNRSRLPRLPGEMRTARLMAKRYTSAPWKKAAFASTVAFTVACSVLPYPHHQSNLVAICGVASTVTTPRFIPPCCFVQGSRMWSCHLRVVAAGEFWSSNACNHIPTRVTTCIHATKRS